MPMPMETVWSSPWTDRDRDRDKGQETKTGRPKRTAKGTGGQNEAGRACARPASKTIRQSSVEHAAIPHRVHRAARPAPERMPKNGPKCLSRDVRVAPRLPRKDDFHEQTASGSEGGPDRRTSMPLHGALGDGEAEAHGRRSDGPGGIAPVEGWRDPLQLTVPPHPVRDPGGQNDAGSRLFENRPPRRTPARCGEGRAHHNSPGRSPEAPRLRRCTGSTGSFPQERAFPRFPLEGGVSATRSTRRERSTGAFGSSPFISSPGTRPGDGRSFRSCAPPPARPGRGTGLPRVAAPFLARVSATSSAEACERSSWEISPRRRRWEVRRASCVPPCR